MKVLPVEHIPPNLTLFDVQLIEKHGIRVHLLVPDAGEYRRSFKMWASLYKTLMQKESGSALDDCYKQVTPSPNYACLKVQSLSVVER